MKVQPKLVKRKASDFELLSDCVAKAILNAEKLKKDELVQLEENKEIEWKEKYNLFGKNPITRFICALNYKFKHVEEGKYTSFWMSSILSIFFSVLQVAFILLSLISIVAGAIFVSNCQWTEIKTIIIQILYICCFLISFVFFILLSIISKITSKEIDTIKDKNYLASVFSGIICFVALIISIIALLRR